MADNDLPELELDGSDLQSLQLNGERLLWTSDLESLKNSVERRLNLQGKWTSPGGISKQFKSSSNNLIMSWYNIKQLTLAFRQGPDGSCFKSKLVDQVLYKKARAYLSIFDVFYNDRPLAGKKIRHCSKQKTVMQIYIQSEGEPVNSSEGRLNPMIIADIEGLKFDLLILQKKGRN